MLRKRLERHNAAGQLGGVTAPDSLGAVAAAVALAVPQLLSCGARRRFIFLRALSDVHVRAIGHHRSPQR